MDSYLSILHAAKKVPGLRFQIFVFCEKIYSLPQTMFYLIDGMGDDIWLYKIMIILGINTQNDRKGHFYI